jgi:hypothetical protein
VGLNEIDIDKVDIGKKNGKFLIYKMFKTVTFPPFACKVCKKCRYCPSLMPISNSVKCFKKILLLKVKIEKRYKNIKA